MNRFIRGAGLVARREKRGLRAGRRRGHANKKAAEALTSQRATENVVVSIGEDYADIRQSIRRICESFPGSYWRDLEARKAYPSEFVKALTEAGYLAALIPEQYGGAGLPLRAAAVILEEIHASGCNAGACHAQMYIMGTLLRHGSEQQKRDYLPKIASGELRLQAFGVTEPTTGSDTTKLKTRAVRDGDHLRHPRPEGLDVARPLFGRDAAPCPHHAARGGAEEDPRPFGVPGRREGLPRQRHGDPAARRHDQSPCDRSVLRRRARARPRISSAKRAKGSATSWTA
jgi:hypothetical protein